MRGFNKDAAQTPLETTESQESLQKLQSKTGIYITTKIQKIRELFITWIL